MLAFEAGSASDSNAGAFGDGSLPLHLVPKGGNAQVNSRIRSCNEQARGSGFRVDYGDGEAGTELVSGEHVSGMPADAVFTSVHEDQAHVLK